MNEQEITQDNLTLLLAPNYVKDVNVKFGDAFYRGQKVHRILTIALEIDDEEANKMACLPGMDDFQFVSFLTPCIQTAIYKTIKGPGHAEVKIEEEDEIV